MNIRCWLGMHRYERVKRDGDYGFRCSGCGDEHWTIYPTCPPSPRRRSQEEAGKIYVLPPHMHMEPLEPLPPKRLSIVDVEWASGPLSSGTVVHLSDGSILDRVISVSQHGAYDGMQTIELTVHKGAPE